MLKNNKFLMAFFAAAIMLVSMAGGAVPQTQTGSVTSIEITATDYKFNPSEIVTGPGKKISVTLKNDGKKTHNIEFKLPGKNVKIDKDLKPGESGTVDLTAPEKTGKYSYICPVGLHSTMGMRGHLIVK